MIKLGFVTCVQLGLSCMKSIYESGGELSLVICLNDEQSIEKSGRVYLDDFCEEKGIHLLKASHVNNVEVIDALKFYEIDWLFIIGWSQIASPKLLSTPTKGVLGIHPTLLPIGRGRASIPWAILKRLPKTGVTLFKLDNGVDTGDIAEQLEIPLGENINATDLYRMVNEGHSALISKVVPNLYRDSIKLIPQDEDAATEWPGRKPSDGQIMLNSSVYEAERLIRAVTHPYPGAFIYNQDGDKMIVWKGRMVETATENPCLFFIDGIIECIDFEIVY